MNNDQQKIKSELEQKIAEIEKEFKAKLEQSTSKQRELESRLTEIQKENNTYKHSMTEISNVVKRKMERINELQTQVEQISTVKDLKPLNDQGISQGSRKKIKTGASGKIPKQASEKIKSRKF